MTIRLNCVFCQGHHQVASCYHFDCATPQQCLSFTAYFAVQSVADTAVADPERQAETNAQLTKVARANPGLIQEARNWHIKNQKNSAPGTYCWSCCHYVKHDREFCPKLTCRACGLRGHSFTKCALFTEQDFSFLPYTAIDFWLEECCSSNGFQRLIQKNLDRLADCRLGKHQGEPHGTLL